VVGRLVAEKLSQMWKQQAVIINRPGAGGLIAAQAAAAVDKDGYSLYMSQASTYNVLPVQQEGKMPVGKPRLSEKEVGAIRAWIESGALSSSTAKKVENRTAIAAASSAFAVIG